MTSEPLILYYTFGNHMHWVDMEWLWGYSVLPDSARDMLRFCEGTGAKGNLNFDGIGYEKMAVEAPDALDEVRRAVADRQIEIVGASYGQPYGLFHGGESNVRQRVYGVRAVMRLLGVRPRTFWEEEFDFFPQLPQMLRGVGYEYASLFFQWTWHTPHIPKETAPAIWWEGLDGSRLLTAPRSDLNLHQWPEDFAGLLESPLLRQMPTPGILQWLELMPSPDWMCRAELMLPPLRALLSRPDFEVRFVTLSEYLEIAREHAVPRRYALDDVFHGMSLGKNGDLFRRLSHHAEQSALAAESLSATMGLFGRPYPHWDVYPAWELEEAWRELLSAQHHDNDECEGLCGHVGRHSYQRSVALTSDVTVRSLRLLAGRTSGPIGRMAVYNPLGWTRDAVIPDPETPQEIVVVRDLPPFGYRVIEKEDRAPTLPVILEETAEAILLRRGSLAVAVERSTGLITRLTSADFPDGAIREDTPLGQLEMTRQGEVERFSDRQVSLMHRETSTVIKIKCQGRDGASVTIAVSLAPEHDAVDVNVFSFGLPRPDPRMHASLQTILAANVPGARLIHDHPYGLSEIRAEGEYLKKYPTGEWMTSPQVFETVRNPFTALQLLDFDGGDRGLLYLHDGSQAMLRDGDKVRNILSMYDAWDEAYFVKSFSVQLRIVPHGPLTHAQRWRLAQEFTRPALVYQSEEPGGDLPPAFGSVWCDAPGVALTAFYRETGHAGANLEHYAGAGMGFPYILRLVEFNGEATQATVRLPGPVAAACRTNLLGEPMEKLEVTTAEPPLNGLAEWSRVLVGLRPYEIATLYLNIEMGRKMPRNLDAHRHVWATVHRAQQRN
jgi:alpha-mannosidase